MTPVAMFLRSLGWPEMVLIAVALLLVFGASRLPKIGTSLGQSMRAFKGALTGQEELDSPDAKTEEVKSSTNGKEKA